MGIDNEKVIRACTLSTILNWHSKQDMGINQHSEKELPNETRVRNIRFACYYLDLNDKERMEVSLHLNDKETEYDIRKRLDQKEGVE